MHQPYQIAAAAAPRLYEHFADCPDTGAVVPDVATIRDIIDIVFWASLRREEGRSPKISLAFLPRALAESALHFARPLPFTPKGLTKIAPAVERPGIHLTVDRIDGELQVWGTTRRIPPGTFVLEVVQPGLLVIKRRRNESSGKYANVMVLEGDQIIEVSDGRLQRTERQPVITQLLGLDSARSWSDRGNVTVQLATSMRAHGRGGTLLIVPATSTSWNQSFLEPVSYEVSPPYREVTELIEQKPDNAEELLWRERLRRAIEIVGGLTAVDGAALINDAYELLAFGAKIRRLPTSQPIQQVMSVDVSAEGKAAAVNVADFGGTRHLSAAQFAQDQPDAIALVASQDGRFTAFSWSPLEEMVWAYRLESLLI
jgi:hypothetical protein